MQFNLESDHFSYMIRAYKPGEISISHPLIKNGDPQQTLQSETLTVSFIMTPKRLIKNWEPQNLQQLKRDSFLPLAELKPELVLLGTGLRLDFPHAEVTSILLNSGIGVEVMDNAAACRTYNILMAEGRNVAAAILQ